MNIVISRIMRKRIIVHIVFVLLLCAIWLCSHLAYNRSLKDATEYMIVYLIIGIVAFVFNMIRKIKHKIIIFVILLLLITIVIFIGVGYYDYSSMYLLLHASKFSCPLIPDMKINISNECFRNLTMYIVYFLLPLTYVYVTYSLSKEVYKKWTKCNKEHKNRAV